MGLMDDLLANMPQEYAHFYIASAFLFGVMMYIQSARWALQLMEVGPDATLRWEWLWSKLPREYVPAERAWRTPWALRFLVTCGVMAAALSAIFIVSMYWVFLVAPWAFTKWALPVLDILCNIVRRGRDGARDRRWWEVLLHGVVYFPIVSLRLMPEEPLAAASDPITAAAVAAADGDASPLSKSARRRHRRRQRGMAGASDDSSSADASDASDDDDAARPAAKKPRPKHSHAKKKGKN